MKKVLFLAFTASTILLSSCGADQAIVDKAVDEMCGAMAKVKEDDPMSSLGALTALSSMANNKEYATISEAQFKETMEKKCPDGYKKFVKLTEKGEEKK